MALNTAISDDRDEREFAFTDRDFSAVVTLVRARAGIALSEHKRELVYSRLARRLRALRKPSFAAYLAYVESEEGASEIGNLINAITTNLTFFFREQHHFDHLHQYLREVAQKRAAQSGSRNLRIWSAGCSTGEEPYSIAMTVADAIPGWESWDARILATDLDTNVLATACAARYKAEAFKSIPDSYRRNFTSGERGGEFEIDPELRRMIAFKQLNLQDRWPLRRQYDAIFCRNVMIYFDDALKHQVLHGFRERLKPGGVLYIGHSESAHIVEQGLHPVGRTTYERVT